MISAVKIQNLPLLKCSLCFHLILMNAHAGACHMFSTSFFGSVTMWKSLDFPTVVDSYIKFTRMRNGVAE
jgi:hypothetical protein